MLYSLTLIFSLVCNRYLVELANLFKLYEDETHPEETEEKDELTKLKPSTNPKTLANSERARELMQSIKGGGIVEGRIEGLLGLIGNWRDGVYICGEAGAADEVQVQTDSHMARCAASIPESGKKAIRED
jgi:hypothetical protein